MVLDNETGYLYICDTGNQRIIKMNTSTGTINYSLTPYGENIEGYYSMIGVQYETIIDSGLILPTGIDIYENYLIVSDYSNGDLIFYDLDNLGINQELKRLHTDRENDLMSIKVGPDGTIWYVGTNTNELIQIIPPLDGDLNGDNNLTLADLILILSHIVGSNLLDPESEIIADINSDNQIDIYDLLHVIDSL
jgi:sugar lactone lactonase YvrE